MSEPQQPSAQPYGAPTPPPQYAPTNPYGAPAGPAHGAPAPSYAGAPTPSYGAPAGNPLGRTAFFVAVGTAVLGILYSLITPFLYTSGNYDIADALATVISILSVVGGATAGVLSILALRRPAPHLLAAVALGISGTVVIGRVLSWLASLLYVLF